MIYIDGIIYSLQNSGGISVYFDEYLKFLDKSNVKNELIIYPNSNPYANKLQVNRKPRLNINIERYIDVSISPESKSDIFHSSYYRLPVNKDNVKIITTVHDFTYEVFPRGVKTKIHHWQKKRAILNSDGIICISESTRKDMLKYIPEAKNIPTKVIYNGVSDFVPLNTKSDKGKYVLFVGAREGYKNFVSCVKALKDHKDIELIVVGGGSFNPEELILLRNTIPGRYSHAGFVNEQELNALYSNAYCLIYPSLYEGFGIPVIEAMRSGCPVIASNSSSVKEIATGAAILLDNITEVDISQALYQLDDKTIREKLVTNGLTNSEKYSWTKMAQETLNFYDEIRDLK
ncbi:glycosyltransferase family 4 protein [Pantoea stewartii]|uniref:glycosyltransferase family 4 protein n=1 Tax=Pantoea stewartii TaxID=66269 RepID=UPI00197F9B5A|nr:glycosyltransferase family 1 protein [Pantoea stewartii]